MVCRLIIILIIGVLSPISVLAEWQIPITNYTQKDYQAGTQNWNIAARNGGFVYVGNNYGLLEFDGVRWQLYGVPNGGAVRTVELSDDGAIWVGSDNEYGFFRSDEKGYMHYTSMSAEALAQDSNFGSVWNIIFIDNEVFVQTRNAIFVHNLNTQTLRIIPSEEYILASAKIGQRIFIARSSGIYAITDYRVGRAIEGSASVAKHDICCLCQLPDGELLIGTKYDGLYVSNGSNKIAPYQIINNSYIRQNQLFALAVSDAYIAMGTVGGGVVICNVSNGSAQTINISNGLQNNTILSLFFDGNNILWCGLDNGIDCINVSSPTSSLYSHNLLGTGYAFMENEGTIYLGTNRGLFSTKCADINHLSADKCDIVGGSVGQVWSLDKFCSDIFCCHDNGLFLVRNNQLQPIVEGEGFFKICHLPHHSDIAVVGSYDGIYLLKQTSEGYTATLLNGFSSSCKTIEADLKGYLWAATDSGIVRLSIDTVTLSLKSELKLPRQPANAYHNIVSIDTMVCLSMNDQSYVVDSESNITQQSPILQRMLGANVFYSDAKQDADGNIWFVVGDALYVSYNKAGQKPISLFSLPQSYVYGFINIAPIDKGNVIVNTVSGFVRGNVSKAIRIGQRPTSRCFIREVRSLAPQSTELYFSIHQPIGPMPVSIPYADNSVRIMFGSMECTHSNVDFSYALSGSGEEPSFSDWANVSAADYTFLSPGTYTFYLRMRINGVAIADQQQMQLTVLPPWWRTWWCILIWIMCAVSIITGIIWASHKRHEAKQQRLMQQNAEEIRRQQERYETQRLQDEKEILRVQNEKIESELKNKSEELSGILLSNVSRNELIQKVKHDLLKVADDLQQKDSKGAIRRIAIMQDKLSSYQEEKVNWKRFEENFDEVNGRFLQKLQNRHPWLTDNEKRLCVYIRAGLMSKEIAPLMSITVRGVEMMRYRMRKKMELPPDTDLDIFLRTII